MIFLFFAVIYVALWAIGLAIVLPLLLLYSILRHWQLWLLLLLGIALLGSCH